MKAVQRVHTNPDVGEEKVVLFLSSQEAQWLLESIEYDRFAIGPDIAFLQDLRSELRVAAPTASSRS